jgi:hypothetical protein
MADALVRMEKHKPHLFREPQEHACLIPCYLDKDKWIGMHNTKDHYNISIDI